MPTRRSKRDGTRQRRHIREGHPNPHGEQEIAETPVQTDHSDVTGENVGQNTSTRGNRLNPSVSGLLEDPTTDSMFNLADPQTTEIIGDTTGKEDSRRDNKQKTSKNRKTA
jgi:hypothetical protein